MNALMTTIPDDERRQAALLKAVGLDRATPEQRELAVSIANRYGLDLMLKHVVLIEGRPYITRDGLLHVAHRSGQFDGMEVTDPAIIEVGGAKFWSARCSVYRKDMSRPFTYAGRYPTTGGNQKFAPEMATKVSEVMALRRAFNVSAPVMEERWDQDMSAAPDPEPQRTLREQVAERRAAITSSPPRPSAGDQGEDGIPSPAAESAESGTSTPGSADDAVMDGQAVDVTPVQCDGFSEELGRCRKEQGHTGAHRNADGTWPA